MPDVITIDNNRALSLIHPQLPKFISFLDTEYIDRNVVRDLTMRSGVFNNAFVQLFWESWQLVYSPNTTNYYVGNRFEFS